MAEAPENNSENAADAAAAAPAKGKVMMMAVGGLVIGLAGGYLGVGPVLAKNKAASPAKVEQKAEGHGEGEKGGGATWPIENLVLNPAGSNGTRFLMVNATFELKDEAAKEAAKDKEPEARDIILALLGKKSIDELADIGQREQIKKEVLAAVAPIFPKGTVTKVFFPQFVIQ
jgi:flagellar FliL protein